MRAVPGPPPPQAPSQPRILAAASSSDARDEFPPEEVPTRRYDEIGTLTFPAQSTVPAPSAEDSSPFEPASSEPSPATRALEERPVTLSDTGAERTFWEDPPRYSLTTVRPPDLEPHAPAAPSRGRSVIARVLFLSLLSLVLVLLVCEASAAWLGVFTPNSSAQLG